MSPLGIFEKKVKRMFWLVGLIGMQQVSGQTGPYGMPGESSGGRQSSFLVLSSYPVRQQDAAIQLMMLTEHRYFSGLGRLMMAGSYKVGGHWFLAGGERTGNEAMVRTRLWGASSLSVSEKTMLGIRIGWQQHRAIGYDSEHGFSAGLGCAFRVSKQMEWRFQGDGLESFWKKGVSESYRIRSMLYYECSSILGISGEVFLEEQREPVVSAGIHYAFANQFYARTAMYSNLNTISVSLGMVLSEWHLEVSSVWHQALGISGSFLIGYRIPSKQ
jgi:hypothetical protein